MAPDVVSALGSHNVYWELFCGSMAVLFAKPPAKKEVVNDLHGDLVNLARTIQHPGLGPALYRRLRRVWFCEGQFRDALAAVRSPWEPGDDPDIDRAFAYFVASWQGLNGIAGTSQHNTNFCRRFSSTGGDPGRRWINAVRSILAWRRRMGAVQVYRSDAFALAEKIEDRDGVAIYADPPYLVKGAKYVHDFKAEDPDAADPLVRKYGDHGRLAGALGRFRRSRVVVSYYDHPALAELYPGWRGERVEVAKSLVNSGRQSRGEAARAPEVQLISDRQLSLFNA